MKKRVRLTPAQIVVLSFFLMIAVGAALLMLPFSTREGVSPPLETAVFTATSAACVTGLTVVDTALAWTTFGHLIIMISMMIGGLGVMTLASILGRAVSHRIGLTQRMLAANETSSRLGEVGSLITAVLVASLSVEAILTIVLLPSFISMGEPLLEAIDPGGRGVVGDPRLLVVAQHPAGAETDPRREGDGRGKFEERRQAPGRILVVQAKPGRGQRRDDPTGYDGDQREHGCQCEPMRKTRRKPIRRDARQHGRKSEQDQERDDLVLARLAGRDHPDAEVAASPRMKAPASRLS